MTTAKRGRAINGDLFTLEHPSLALDAPFTSFIDVSFRGTTHQAFVAADQHAFTYAHVTGEFSVGKFAGHILENLDTVSTQVSHRYQALVTTPAGVLSIHSYEDVPSLLALIGALQPEATELGITLHPNHEAEFTTAPKVALQLDFGVLEITPLTEHVIEQLPAWQGTAVAGGDLYAGRFSDESPYLTLVTPTCRVLALPNGSVDHDVLAATIAELKAGWT